MTDLARALEVALDAAAAARTLLLAECARPDGPRGEIGHCPADDEAEWIIRERLLAAFPDWGYLGEETGIKPAAAGAEHVWIVDPNDGTTSMQRGYRGHAVSIALVARGAPVLGLVWAVDAPDGAGDLITWADGCGPLRRNGSPVDTALRHGQLEPHDVVCVSQGANRNPLGNFPCTAPARFIGSPSIAYRLALVAAGDCVATMSVNRTQAWDHAAGHALLRGAGGVLVDENGLELTYGRDGHSQSRWVFGGSSDVVAQLLHRPWQRAAGSGFGEAVPPPSLAPVRARPGHLVHDVDGLRRAHGCLLGQVAGDALGALVEFSSAASIARAYPDGGPRLLASGGPHRIAAGQPTDDSEMALMLARTLVASGQFDQEAVAVGYGRWMHGWTHADMPEPCGHDWCRPFDVGGTTRQALGAITLQDARTGRAATSAMAAASKNSQANGALMRVSPLGIWGARRAPSEVAEAARLDARLTHPHPICQDASALFAVTIAAAIGRRLDNREAYAFALEWGRGEGLDAAVLSALERAASEPPPDFLSQQGWVLIALQNAFFQLRHAGTLADGVVATVRAGGDTDTNAAICGALLGAVHGRPAIPAQWQRMVLTCRPMVGQPDIQQPRPAVYWP
ncbi:MAG TPA: inositol monophosphatase family protein, partial [Chloroflexota bacterium]